MIPGTFEYFRANSVSEAAKLLHKSKNSSVLAGGHSLLPMMKLRVAAPSALVDLAGIAALRGIKKVGSNIVIGAMTTQQWLQRAPSWTPPMIAGNLCRCTGYQNIVKAIQHAAAKLRGEEFLEAAE